MKCALYGSLAKSNDHPVGFANIPGNSPPQAISWQEKVYAPDQELTTSGLESGATLAYREVEVTKLDSSSFEQFDINKVGQRQTA